MIVRWLLLVILLLTPSVGLGEAIHADLGSIKFHADYYERDDLKKEIVARGNVSLSMGDDHISAKEVRINTETKDIIAEGPVVFQTTGFRATAERMTYNFSTRLGVLEKAEVISEAEAGQATTRVTFQPKRGFDILAGAPNARFSGESIEKGPGIRNWIIYNGEFTNCVGCKVPEWKFRGSKLRTTEDGDVIISDPTFYLFNVPVLYLPWAVIPYTERRKTGFLAPNFDISDNNGFGVEEQLFLVLGRSQDLTASYGFLEKRGNKPGFEYRYRFAEEFGGRVAASYLRDRKFREEFSEYNVNPDRYVARLINMGFFPYRVDAKWDWTLISDDDYARDFPDEAPGLGDAAIQSTGIFAKHWDLVNLSAEALFYNDITPPNPQSSNGATIQRLPEVRGSILQVPFFDDYMTLKLDTDYVNFTTEKQKFIELNGTPEFQFGTDALLRAQRFDVHPEIAFYFQPVRAIEFVPTFIFQESIYILPGLPGVEDRDGEFRYFSTGARLIADIEKVFDVDWGNVKRIRHQIEPEIRYNYLPALYKDQIPLIDLQSTTTTRNSLTYLVTQWLDLRKVSEDGFPIFLRAIEFRAIQTLNLQRIRNNFGREFSDLEMELNIIFPNIQSNTEMFWGMHGEGVNQVSTGWSIQDLWNNNYFTNFSYNKTDDRRNIRGGVQLGMFSWVKAFFNLNYSFDDRQFIEQMYGLSFIPKSKCWRIDLGYVDRLDSDTSKGTIGINLIYGIHDASDRFSKYRQYF